MLGNGRYEVCLKLANKYSDNFVHNITTISWQIWCIIFTMQKSTFMSLWSKIIHTSQCHRPLQKSAAMQNSMGLTHLILTDLRFGETKSNMNIRLYHQPSYKFTTIFILVIVALYLALSAVQHLLVYTSCSGVIRMPASTHPMAATFSQMG